MTTSDCHRELLLLATACAGCFGEGPVPTVPTGVEIVMAVESNITEGFDGSMCAPGPYIGDVAIGNGYVHAVLLQAYAPRCGGIQLNNYSPQIRRVALPGSPELADEPAGNTRSYATVRVMATTNLHAVVSSPGDEAQDLDFDASSERREDLFIGGFGFVAPTGLVGDATHAYVVGTNSGGGSELDFNAPKYPCCTSGSSGTLKSIGWRIPWVKPALPTPSFELLGLTDVDAVYPDTLKRGLVANDSELFYKARRDNDGRVELKAMLKATATTMPGVSRFVVDQVDVLTGLAASNSAIVWTTTSTLTGGSPPPACTVWKQDLPSATWAPTQLFTTTKFSCLDAEIDDSHVYFTIVSVNSDNGGDNMGGTTNNRLRGIGLGRVSLTGGEPETIRHGIDTDYIGPRRVYLHADDVFAVDPYTIVRIGKLAYAGKHDF